MAQVSRDRFHAVGHGSYSQTTLRQTLRLFAGAGIVAGSVPESEVAESDAKLIPMRDALTAPAPS